MTLSRGSIIFQELAGTTQWKGSRLLSVWIEYCKVHLSHIYAGLTCQTSLTSLPQSHPKAAPFHKKGFPLYNKISNLIDGTHATSEFTFWTGQSPGNDFNSHINPMLLGISNTSTSTSKSHASFDWEKEREEYSETENPVMVCTSLITSYPCSNQYSSLQWSPCQFQRCRTRKMRMRWVPVWF